MHDAYIGGRFRRMKITHKVSDVAENLQLYQVVWFFHPKSSCTTTHISADVQRTTLGALCMTISGGRTEQIGIFCRVAGFMSDFLSFVVVELIQFFHGALQLCFIIVSVYWCIFHYSWCVLLFWLISIPRSSLGSAPSLPSYSQRVSQTGHVMRHRASLPPVICQQGSTGSLPRSPSPSTRRLSLQGHRQHARLAAADRLGRTPSTPAFCATVQPSSASPVVKVMSCGCCCFM